TGVGNSHGWSDDCACYVDNAPYGNQIVALPPDLSSVLASDAPPLPTTADDDFGAAPLLFQPRGCPPLAAMNNKNGALYIWNRRLLCAVGADRQASLEVPDRRQHGCDSDHGRRHGLRSGHRRLGVRVPTHACAAAAEAAAAHAVAADRLASRLSTLGGDGDDLVRARDSGARVPAGGGARRLRARRSRARRPNRALLRRRRRLRAAARVDCRASRSRSWACPRHERLAPGVRVSGPALRRRARAG